MSLSMWLSVNHFFEANWTPVSLSAPQVDRNGPSGPRNRRGSGGMGKRRRILESAMAPTVKEQTDSWTF